MRKLVVLLVAGILLAGCAPKEALIGRVYQNSSEIPALKAYRDTGGMVISDTDYAVNFWQNGNLRLATIEKIIEGKGSVRYRVEDYVQKTVSVPSRWVWNQWLGLVALINTDTGAVFAAWRLEVSEKSIRMAPLPPTSLVFIRDLGDERLELAAKP